MSPDSDEEIIHRVNAVTGCLLAGLPLATKHFIPMNANMVYTSHSLDNVGKGFDTPTIHP